MAKESLSYTARGYHTVFSSILRLLLLGYAALSVFTFFEIQALLHHSKDDDSFEIVNGTLFIPLILCFPNNLQVDGLVIVESTTNTTTSSTSMANSQCGQLDYLISACAYCLLLSGAACIFFVVSDMSTRCGRHPVGATMHSASGKAVLLALLLVQSGISVGALVEQNHYGVQYFDNVVSNHNLDLDVQSYSNSILLIGSSLSSFVIAFSVLVEATLSTCCRLPSEAKETFKEQDIVSGSCNPISEIDDTGSKGKQSYYGNEPGTTVGPSNRHENWIIPAWCILKYDADRQY